MVDNQRIYVMYFLMGEVNQKNYFTISRNYWTSPWVFLINLFTFEKKLKSNLKSVFELTNPDP